jgi:hypothetical protein
MPTGTVFLTLLLSQIFIHDDPKADHWIRAAMEANYNLRLDESQSYTQALKANYPDHPVGYLLSAERYWWQSQTDPANKQVERDYYAAQEAAVEKAQKALIQGKYAKTELLSYLASSYGSLTRFQVTRKSAYFSAMRAGVKAVRFANEVHQIDPNYYDVYLGLGAYNYFSATLPSVIRPFAYLIGVRGQKELGLEQVRTAMEKSRYSQTEAKIVYYGILLEEKRYADAFQVLEPFLNDFPSNFVFYDWIADWFERQWKFDDGSQYFESLSSRQNQTSSLLAKHALLTEAGLQHTGKQDTLARQTLSRVRALSGSDALIDSELVRLEKAIK